jgi:hypothetical protein
MDNKKRSAKDAEEVTKTNDSSERGPVWDDHFNRVKVAVFKHPTKDKKWRFTSAIFRSYVDRDDGSWHNVYYYDKKDLVDVIKAAQRALEQIDHLEGLNVA